MAGDDMPPCVIRFIPCYLSVALQPTLGALVTKQKDMAPRSQRFMPQQITKLPFACKASLPHPDKSQPCRVKRVLETGALMSHWGGAIVGLASRKGDDPKPPPFPVRSWENARFPRVFSSLSFFFFGRDQFIPTEHSSTFTKRIDG